MAQKIVVNVETGEQTYVDLTAEEEADRAAVSAEHDAAHERAERREAFLAEVALSPSVLDRLRSGEPPSTPELWRIVRYLAARELVDHLVE